NPHEVAVSSGGLLYMALSLAYAALSTLLFAYPTWRSLVGGRNAFSWTAPDGLLVLAALVLLCALFTLVPLLLGSHRLSRWEPSDCAAGQRAGRSERGGLGRPRLSSARRPPGRSRPRRTSA